MACALQVLFTVDIRGESVLDFPIFFQPNLSNKLKSTHKFLKNRSKNDRICLFQGPAHQQLAHILKASFLG